MNIESSNLPKSVGGKNVTTHSDRRYARSQSELQLGSTNNRIVRPQMVSQNGVITINSNSDIPRRVDLRRAKSLRVGNKDHQPKRYSVIFDVPEKTNDVSNNNERQGPKKPPRLKIHERPDDEEQPAVGSPNSGFNSIAFRRSLANGLARVRSFSGRDADDKPRVERRPARTSGAYVQFRDQDGDWRRHSIRRISQYETCAHTFKVMLIGDSCVGKTCLLTRFKDGTFLSGSFISTVGIDFRNKVVTVDGSKVKLQIWDTAGQERFRSVTHAYYRDAHALLLLYDVMNKNSYDNTRAWLAEVHEYAQDDVVIMLIGNKCDVNGERVVRREDGERLAREYNVAFMETSAKTGLNVDLAFMAVARELKARKSNNPNDRKFNVADYVRQEAKTEACLCNVG
ncbi:ras-related protein Rab-8A isoform X2 [Procambarus clarkii]|uniref:ras-related protein Rab-8A isoform X2 n=1 Tax=Procambarus clarkii TaxID=6728 RepID=UPI003743232B